MKIVHLNDVCEIIAGQSPPSKFYNDQGIGLPFFQGKADFGELHPNVRVWCSEPKKVAEAGDILISVRAPVGPTNLANQKSCIGRGLSAIRPSKGIDTKFLLHYLRAIEPKLANMGSGSTFSAITQKDLRAIEVPLPPLAEQQRIAAILDKADALRAKRRAALAKLDTLLQATFLDMFGDPVTNPKGWKQYELGELLSTIIDYRGKTPPKSPSGIPLISAANIKNGRVDISKPQFISHETYKKWTTRGFTKPGDVLITTEAPVGSVAAYPEKGIYQISRRVMALRPKPNLILSEYLLEVMLNPKWHTRLTAVTRGSTVPRVLKPDITTQLIPIPPLKLQRSFVNQKSTIITIREKHKSFLHQSDVLFKTLQQRAFKGELTSKLGER